MKEVRAANDAMLSRTALAESQGMPGFQWCRRLDTLKANVLRTVINRSGERIRKLTDFLGRLGPAFEDLPQLISEVQAKQEADIRIREEAIILDKISSFVYHTRYTQILQPRLGDTCRWLLKDNSYETWRSASVSGYLWLCGKSKCTGKTPRQQC